MFINKKALPAPYKSELTNYVERINRNFNKLCSLGYSYYLKFMYYGGLPFSIVYGLYTRPPMVMMAYYYLTGNE